MKTFFLGILLLASAAAPALAHPGDHGALSLAELAGHLVEPDHLLFLALAIAAGILGYRFGRRSEARARARRRS